MSDERAKELAKLVLQLCGFTVKRTLLILAIALGLAFAIYALASGPSLVEIIDNPKF